MTRRREVLWALSALFGALYWGSVGLLYATDLNPWMTIPVVGLGFVWTVCLTLLLLPRFRGRAGS